MRRIPWAVAFGTNLSRSTAIAILDPDGQWPKSLAGTTVQGERPDSATVLCVTRTDQFSGAGGDGVRNAELDYHRWSNRRRANRYGSDAEYGRRSVQFGHQRGRVPGAILNGVTYAPAPFLVETVENGGADLRTRLAIYATGLRYAGNPTHDSSIADVSQYVTAQGRDSTGRNYNFTVEYAGPAPGFFGLDQVNIVVPASLDGVGDVSLTIATENGPSNVVTFRVNSLPSLSIRLAGLSLSTNFITGGSSLTGTVSLNGVARLGGFPVTLRTGSTAVQMPLLVTIPAGQAVRDVYHQHESRLRCGDSRTSPRRRGW